MRTVLLALLSVKGKGAATLIHGMSDDVVMRKVRMALTDYGKNFAAFKPSLQHLGEVTTLRNQLVHWVPFVNSSKTTIGSFVDAYRHYRNPTQPELNCTPKRLRDISHWLQQFEWDLVTILLAIDRKTRLDPMDYRTLAPGYTPDVPKSSYPSKV